MIVIVSHAGRTVAVPCADRVLIAEVAHRAAWFLDAIGGPWTLERGWHALPYDSEVCQMLGDGAQVELVPVPAPAVAA